MSRTGRQMVFVGAGRPLECREGTVADPEAGAVLVRTVIAGVCGTDAHRLDGDLPDPGRPVCFGHEGIGRVEMLGDGVSTDTSGTPVAPDDLVYWTPGSARPGAVPVTGWPPPAEVPNPASYQDYATLPPTNPFFCIPEGVDPESVIAFGCAMPTAHGGFDRLGPIRPGQSVVIQGCGPVGLAATVLAGLTAASHVIVIGAPDERLRAAERLGATTTISLDTTSEADRRLTILDLTGGSGPDVVIEAAGQMPAFPEGLGLLAEQGRYLVLGLYSGRETVPFDPIRLNNLSQSVIGSMGPSSFADYRSTIALARRLGRRLGFAELITHRFELADLEQAIAIARSGQAIKAVVIPDR